MTTIATRTIKPIRRRVAELDRTAADAAKSADRTLSRAKKRARGIIGNGWSIAKEIHDRIEDRPHASVVVALALGGVMGYLLKPRH